MAELSNLERIGRAIAHERNVRGLSQSDVAVRAAVDRSTVVKIEAGRPVMPPNLYAVCEVVGLYLTVSRTTCAHDFEHVCRFCGERAG